MTSTQRGHQLLGDHFGRKDVFSAVAANLLVMKMVTRRPLFDHLQPFCDRLQTLFNQRCFVVAKLLQAGD